MPAKAKPPPPTIAMINLGILNSLINNSFVDRGVFLKKAAKKSAKDKGICPTKRCNTEISTKANAANNKKN
jgi:hypothetical protein